MVVSSIAVSILAKSPATNKMLHRRTAHGPRMLSFTAPAGRLHLVICLNANVSPVRTQYRTVPSLVERNLSVDIHASNCVIKGNACRAYRLFQFPADVVVQYLRLSATKGQKNHLSVCAYVECLLIADDMNVESDVVPESAKQANGSRIVAKPDL